MVRGMVAAGSSVADVAAIFEISTSTVYALTRETRKTMKRNTGINGAAGAKKEAA